jgi:hypothetical protein
MLWPVFRVRTTPPAHQNFLPEVREGRNKSRTTDVNSAEPNNLAICWALTSATSSNDSTALNCFLFVMIDTSRL